MAVRPPLLLRRLRALLRRLGLASPGAGGPGGIEGFVDDCVAGEIRGWAFDPDHPDRRMHVLALSHGRVVGETLADISRADLAQQGRGDGRHGFRIRLPAVLLDGERQTLQVKAVAGGTLAPLNRGEIVLEHSGEDMPAAAASGAGLPDAAPLEVEESPPPPVLALWPGDADLAKGFEGEVVRLGGGAPDLARLWAAHTVLFACPGDRIDAAAADILLRSRPLADVATWDGSDATSRRPEARALGLLLGEGLGGRFAMRGHVLALAGAPLLQALASGNQRGTELVLASRPELRWAHLPGPLVVSPAPCVSRAEAVAPASPERISLAVWPAWSAAAARSLETLIAQTGPGLELEVLVEASGAEEARRLAGVLGRDLAVRPVDAPAAATAGAWLAALAAGASGEAVILCQAGVRLGHAPGAIDQIAAWATTPGAGTVTVEVRRAGEPLAGLALARSVEGWAARSAFSPALTGLSRPVLGAPAAFLAIGRDRLAMLGGLADARLPAGGADLDLALRLRRIGLGGVLLGGLSAEAEAGVEPSGELSGAALAAFDPAELAAAAAAWPAPLHP
jgi:hypothetical protein